ncbi:uncharacterized protein METZ01_LOCUS276428, partial [marine metagenome]
VEEEFCFMKLSTRNTDFFVHPLKAAPRCGSFLFREGRRF